MTDDAVRSTKLTGARPVRDLYDLLTGDEDARVCRDIPDAACREQPGNFFVHLGSLTLTKIGDALADAKLTLAWVLAAVGAPAFMTALLVPVRESLALLPQLVVASVIRRFPVRKWFWTAGSAVQGICVLAMALVCLSASGTLAGWLIIALLALFSLARGVCSVASKDVLGKTVSKTRRGTVTGYAASAAGLVAVGIGLYLQVGDVASRSQEFLASLLFLAGAAWLVASGIYALMAEQSGSTEGGGDAGREAIAHLALVIKDAPLRHFLIARTLLLGTALVTPFYVMLANQQSGSDIGGLGLLIVASALAGALSAPVWGRLADRSSRLVMMAAALVASGVGFATFGLVSFDAAITTSSFFYAAAIFGLGIAHSGVRLGRKTYLVDMAREDNRAVYVAVSNTVIGVALLVAGGIGAAAERFGAATVIAILSSMTLLAAIYALRLEEVQASEG